ncbi:MAG: hypothetical protein Kow0077_26000 [Anaerolineae bacterium]
MEITLDVTVDELVAAYPDAVGFLADHHVVCIVCGEPYWGTLGELMASKGIEDPAALLEELKAFLAQREAR